MLTAELLADLRVALLQKLYQVQPLGRSAGDLQTGLKNRFASTTPEVEGQLEFLKGESHVVSRPANELAPGLPPYWFITSTGMKFCEGNKLV